MKGKGTIVIVLAVVVGIGLGVGGTLGTQKFLFPQKAATTQKTTTTQSDGPVVQIGEFTLNLQGGAFLKASIAVEGTDKKSEAIIKAKDAFIKDRINMVLTSKSVTDMQAANREKLRKELITQLNEVTGNNIQDVLFLTFVYQ